MSQKTYPGCLTASSESFLFASVSPSYIYLYMSYRSMHVNGSMLPCYV